jgi:hypothetical protein
MACRGACCGRGAGRYLRVPITLSHYAAWENSWTRLPGRSRRRTRSWCPEGVGAAARPVGSAGVPGAALRVVVVNVLTGSPGRRPPARRRRGARRRRRAEPREAGRNPVKPGGNPVKMSATGEFPGFGQKRPPFAGVGDWERGPLTEGAAVRREGQGLAGGDQRCDPVGG